MKTVIIGILFALIGCGAPPEQTAETQSSFTCASFNPFTHVCIKWVPSLPPGAPINDVPAGNPSWCTPSNSVIPAEGWMEIRNDQPVSTGAQCAVIPPGNYYNLGDWDYTSTIKGVPSVHIQSFLTGPRAYAFLFAQPNLVDFIEVVYPNGSGIITPTVIGSIELLLGQ